MITVKGNATVASRKYNVSSFIHLHLSVNGQVQLCQSDEEKVEIETNENLFHFIDVVNSGKTLFITSEEGYRKPQFSQLKVKVYFRKPGMYN